MENYLNENFEVKPKHSSDEVLQKWRRMCGLVKNPKRRFRFTANIEQRNEAAAMRRANHKLRAADLVSKAALHMNVMHAAGFGISADDAGTIFEAGHNPEKLKLHGGVDGLVTKLKTCTTNGLAMDDKELATRQEHFGTNEFTEREQRGFWVLVWEALLQDMTIMVPAVCAFVSLIAGIATEGWPKGSHVGLGIVASILLDVFVSATIDYRQSLRFRDLVKEKKKMSIEVTRNGTKQKLLIYELLPGDIVHLGIGDQIHADGLFLSGLALSIDKSSLTGEIQPVRVNIENPYLLSGTKVLDGSCKMLVVAVGMRTQLAKIMATPTGGRKDETQSQVKLNGVAIRIILAIAMFAVLVQKLLACKIMEGTQWSCSGDDVLVLLEYFASIVAIFVFTDPEVLPLAVTLGLAFDMKMMNVKALVRNLAACKTMGSVTTICTDKTATNHMIVVKSCICMNVGTAEHIPDSAKKILVQSIFTNTGGEVVSKKEGKREILGSPTDTAILKFGLSLGGDFHVERKATKVLRVEPFNSTKKEMGVVLELPGGGVRAHRKGASEIVLAACDKVINESGEVVALDDEKLTYLKSTIDSFAGEALQTLCLAYIDLESGVSAETPIPSSGYTCIGIVGIKDHVHPGVRESVALCRSAGITVRMVTGDNITTAKAIARECGILTDDGIAIEGPDFREKTLEELLIIIPKIQVMARSSSRDKHMLVDQLRTTFGEVVAVTGDGTNDAQALRDANIGLAMGIAGTEVAKESADVIILDDNFSTIVTVAKWGRSVYVNFQKFVQFQLTVNIVTLIVNFTSASLTGSAPLTATQLLWVNMIMDTLGALALATEPPNDELMKRAPVGRKGNFISNVMWRNIFGQAVYQFAVIWLLQSQGKSFFGLDGDDSDLILNTLIFNCFVFCQLFNEVNSREMEKENVLDGIWKNKVFVSVIAATVIFQVIIIEYLGTFANTSPLKPTQWFFSIFTGFLSMPIAVFLKKIPV